MSKKKLEAGIIACTIGIIVVIVLVMPYLLQTPISTHSLSVSISPLGAGSVSPSGGEYVSGGQVTLTASPTIGYTFDYWSGGASGTTSNITITMDSNKSLTANFKAISTLIDYEVTILSDSAYLSVRVEGPQKSYDIILLDPEGESVGYGFISSDDMITGNKTVEVSMTGTGVKNPMPGEYSLIVKEWPTDEKVFEAKPVFEGPDVSVTYVRFKTDYDGCSGESSIDGVIARVYNGGDLPVFPDEIKLFVAGKHEDITIYESLPHGETTVIDRFVQLSGLGRGTHRVMVQIYSEGIKLTSYETQVKIG